MPVIGQSRILEFRAAMARRDLAKILAEKTAEARSPLYTWMEQNYAELRRALPVNRPSWVALCKTAIEVGFVPKGDKPLTPAAVRSAWLRVDADKRRDQPAPTPTPTATREPTQQLAPATPTRDQTDVQHSNDQRGRGFVFKPLPTPDPDKWGPKK